MIKPIPLTIDAAKFWRRVDVVDPCDCWEWLGHMHHSGYGKFRHKDAFYPAHRVAYALLCGEPGPLFVMDHLCRNRLCCNPNHLQAVTSKVNTRRGKVGRQAGQVRRRVVDGVPYCKNGHAVVGDNAYLVKDNRRGTVHVGCRACNNRKRRD